MSDAGEQRDDEVDDAEEAAGVEEWIADEAGAQAPAVGLDDGPIEEPGRGS